MVRRIQKSRSRGEFEREERLASETLGSSRRNVAPEAYPTEQVDYEEENRSALGDESTARIQAGTYEDDYRTGVEGRRETGQTSRKSEPTRSPLPRNERTVGGGSAEKEDFPTGKWARQKTRARLSKAKTPVKPTPRGANGTKTPRRTSTPKRATTKRR